MADWGSFKARPDADYKNKDEKFITEIFLDVMTQEEKEDWKPQIRGSSLPICILLHSQDLLRPHVRPIQPRLEHYAEQGTAFHNLYQKKFMQSKKYGKYVFGDFCCKNPKCEEILYSSVTRPADWREKKCPKCGSIGLKYSELEGFYKGIIGFHVDLVLKFSDTDYHVIEFKTTGSYNIADLNMKFKPKHFAQASSYPIVLKKEFGINVTKFYIGYSNRDAPQYSKTSKRQSRFFPFKTNTDIVKKRKKQLDNIVAGEKARIEYFENPTVENLNALDDLRPCKSSKDYSEPLMGMKDRYETSECCPYAKGKKCFRSGLSRAAKDLHKLMKEKGNDREKAG